MKRSAKYWEEKLFGDEGISSLEVWAMLEDLKRNESKIANCLRMIAGAQSSPDYPANLPALLEELKEELERAA